MPLADAIQARIQHYREQIAELQASAADLTEQASQAENPRPVFDSLHRVYDRIAVAEEFVAELTTLAAADAAEEAEEEAGQAAA